VGEQARESKETDRREERGERREERGEQNVERKLHSPNGSLFLEQARANQCKELIFFNHN
jgi:hypothetical protein